MAAAKPATTKGPDEGDSGDQQQQAPGDQGQPPAPQPARSVRIPNERFGNQNRGEARGLLFQVCRRFGVDPSLDKRPEELLAWTYHGADEQRDIPDAVTIVTAGGRKLKLFRDDTIDDDNVAMLARAFRIPPHPDGSPWTAAELPDDLTLPTVEVTGISGKTDHVYKKGYLREGGRGEAERRQALRKPGSK